MILFKSYYNNCDVDIWKACNGKEHLLFCAKTEYIDASHLSRNTSHADVTLQWRNHPTTKKLFAWLETHNEIPDKELDIKGVKSRFIHPTLVPHFATWLNPKLNYPICKLLQAITINCDKGLQATPPIIPTHTFIFLKLNSNSCLEFLKYYAIECKPDQAEKLVSDVMSTFKKAERIFQHDHVPNTTKVLKAIANDWHTRGYIGINKQNYCATTLSEVQICDMLRHFCNSTHDPTICKSAYDSVDNIDCKYDYVE